jgi:hypothetical protein
VGLYIAAFRHNLAQDGQVPRLQSRVVTSSMVNWHPKEAAADVSHFNGCVRIARDPAAGSEYPFLLEQLDVDAATEKLLSVSQSLKTQMESGVVPDRRVSTMSSLRTGGISLLMRGPASRQAAASVRAAALRTGMAAQSYVDLYAEDLAIGFRADMAELKPEVGRYACRGPWRSVVRRKVRDMRVGGHDIRIDSNSFAGDEGIITPHARLDVGASDADANGQLRVFEELFCWRGWNLCAPPAEATTPRRRSDSKHPVISYLSDGSLPRQRFGWGYEVGLRVVYLDGHSVSVEEAAAVYDGPRRAEMRLGTDQVGGTTEPGPNAESAYFAPFFRYESIQPAVMRDLSGHSVYADAQGRTNRLLVSSDGQGKPMVRDVQAQLVPPSIELDAAIRCGMFDTAAARQQPPKTASVPDPWASRLILGVYRTADDKLLRLEYFDYYEAGNQWPNYRPLTLRVATSANGVMPANGVDVTLSGETLLVTLAPGQEVTLRHWHEISEKQLTASGIVEAMATWLVKPDPEAVDVRNALALPVRDDVGDMRDQLIEVLSHWHDRDPANLKRYLARGRASVQVNLTSFSMLNPANEVRIVHAIPVPARAPRFSDAAPLPPRSLPRLPMQVSAIAERFDLVREKLGETIAPAPRGWIARRRGTRCRMNSAAFP